MKRFAWAHHFSHLFGHNPQELRFADTATVAAAQWLATDPVLEPTDYRDWSGTWIHRDKPDPPTDTNGKPKPGERQVHRDAWNLILDKRAKAEQRKPPTYYAVFVFDGDNVGKLVTTADRERYRAISGTLGDFARGTIRGIVERKQPDGEKRPHFGQLIYAGGDDAICVLPTATALTCAKEINEEFDLHWQRRLPDEDPATLSGGLVVAHYKEDLRFVVEEARKAEKKAKDAGRNALCATVCRRSGEHTSAVVPWDFLPTVTGWVNGFLNKASDRWAYRLRAELDTLGTDRPMFALELTRQLGRAEEVTRKQFPVGEVAAAFDAYPGAVLDFVTLVQTASFLARGRDA